MFHVELAPLGGIFDPLKSHLGVFWPFRGTEWADFDLLESNSIYIFVHKNQKNYHRHFFSLDACSSPMCPYTDCCWRWPCGFGLCIFIWICAYIQCMRFGFPHLHESKLKNSNIFFWQLILSQNLIILGDKSHF